MSLISPMVVTRISCFVMPIWRPKNRYQASVSHGALAVDAHGGHGLILQRCKRGKIEAADDLGRQGSRSISRLLKAALRLSGAAERADQIDRVLGHVRLISVCEELVQPAQIAAGTKRRNLRMRADGEGKAVFLAVDLHQVLPPEMLRNSLSAASASASVAKSSPR